MDEQEEILGNALFSISEEMAVVEYRSSFSPIIREMLDSRTSTLILGHLSEHNNHPEIVRLMAQQSLEERSLAPTLVVAEPGKAQAACIY